MRDDLHAHEWNATLSKPLPTTRVYQLYRDAIRPGELDTGLAQIATADPGAIVAFHGFPGELPAHYDGLAARAAAHGLTPAAAFGLDSKSTSGTAKGEAIGDVGARQNCALVLIDCESHFDEHGAAEMHAIGDAARAKAPDALLIAQPWPEPLMHSGFPYEEENAFCDANGPQWYFGDWRQSLGKDRVEHLRPVFERQWAAMNAGRLKSCLRRMTITLQSEGWDDIPHELVSLLAEFPGAVVWCDKGLARSPAWWEAVKAASALAQGGFIGPDAVRRFQASVGLTADGTAGPLTLHALGC